jgi:hypothetical protein
VRLLSSLVVLALLLLVGWLFLRERSPGAPPGRPATAEAPCARTPPVDASVPPRPAPAALRWIAVGAVESPEQNQVQIEQDLELARAVLGERSGLVLYAGGAGSRDVQVDARQSRGDPLLAELSALLAPRGGRASRYRAGRLPRHGPASLPALEDALRSALARPGAGPLTLLLAGHGERGERHAQNYVALWGGRRLDAGRLAGLLDGARRPLRLVVTSCYGGGFAEALFVGADPARGAGRDRCGFFATTADLPATGCDPNPDRPEQEGYALHLLNALRGRDRDGRVLPRGELELDGDGAISFAEAHARARIALGSIDVPTATSERWLREAVKSAARSSRATGPGGRGSDEGAPEELAVVRALARRTGLPAALEHVRGDLRAREEKIDEAYGVYDDAARAEDDAAGRARAELLARWPVIDDPFHPEFAETLRCERAAIAAYLKRSRACEDYREAVRATDEAEADHWALRRKAAPVERLLRALENLALARRLSALGGEGWARYQAILACERTRP